MRDEEVGVSWKLDKFSNRDVAQTIYVVYNTYVECNVLLFNIEMCAK